MRKPMDCDGVNLELDANVRILVFSVAIILIMIFVPGGLHQLGRRLLAGWRQ